MMMYSSGKRMAVSTDPYPWVHPNGGRIPLRFGFKPFDIWAPRVEFFRRLTNPANPILAETVRPFLADGNSFAELVSDIDEWDWFAFGATMQEIEHARRVLSRLKGLHSIPESKEA